MSASMSLSMSMSMSRVLRQPQADRESFSHDRDLLRFIHDGQLADGLHPLRPCSYRDELLLRLQAKVGVQIAGAVSRHSCQLHRCVGRGVEALPALAQQLREPRLRGARRHHVVQACVERLACSQPSDAGPDARVLVDPRALQQPVAQLHAARDRHALERRQHHAQLVLTVRDATRLLQVRLLRGDDGVERVADVELLRLRQTA